MTQFNDLSKHFWQQTVFCEHTNTIFLLSGHQQYSDFLYRNKEIVYEREPQNQQIIGFHEYEHNMDKGLADNYSHKFQRKIKTIGII